MTTIAQQLGQLEQDIYALAKRPSSEVLLAIDSRISAIRAAVGGEAVVVAHRLHTPGGKWQWMNGMPSKQALDDSKNFGWEMEYAYASPTATVDAGALRELVEKWKELANQAPRYGERSEGYVAGVELCSLELAVLIGGSK